MFNIPFSLKFPRVLHLLPFQSFSWYPIDIHQVLFNFCEFCNPQGGPALQEDWKSTVSLGRKMSRSTLRTLLSEAYCILCWGFTIPFLHFTAAFLFPCFLPSASFLSFYPDSTHILFSSISSFYFLNVPCFFLYTLHLLFFILFLFYILETTYLS